jgi:hypothetical protein
MIKAKDARKKLCLEVPCGRHFSKSLYLWVPRCGYHLLFRWIGEYKRCSWNNRDTDEAGKREMVPFFLMILLL